MKSSYELAMERLGGPDVKLSKEKKQRLAEIDRKYKAKVAEIKLLSGERLKKAADSEALEKVQSEIGKDMERALEQCEREKENVRKGE